MKRVLITGGAGFLGSHLCDRFISNGYFVIAMDNLITGDLRNISHLLDFPNFEFINHDITKKIEIKGKLDFILNFASPASPIDYLKIPIETLKVGSYGAHNCLDLAKSKNARILVASTSEIYGDPDPRHVPMQESYRGNVSTMGPRACYDESKRVGETLCYIYHEYFGVHTNIIRPFNVYGPGMQENDYRVLPNFASRIKSGMPLHIYGQGNQTRTFCYLTDAMVGFLLVNLKGVPGEVYNIGNPSPEISINELVGVMEKSIGRKIPKEIIEYPDSYPADEPMRRCPDIRKAKLQLNFQPEIDLQEGIERFLNWAEKIYIGEN